MIESHSNPNPDCADPTAGFRPALYSARGYFGIFVLALLVRLVVVAISTVTFEGWAPDDNTYFAMAETAAAGETEGWDAYTAVLYNKTLAFTGALTLLYRLLGPSEVAGQVFVALLGATSALLVARVAREGLPERVAAAAGVSIALLPSQVIWSSLLLKDAAVWVALLGLAGAMLMLRTARGWRSVVATLCIALALVALGHLREHTLVVAAVAASITALFQVKRWGAGRTFAVLALAVLIPWSIGIGPAGLTLVTNAGSLEQRRLANAERARTGFIEIPTSEDHVSDELAALEETIINQRVQLEALRQVRRHALTAQERRRVTTRLERLEVEVRMARRNATRLRDEPGEQAVAADDPGDPDSLSPHLQHLPRGIFVMLLEPTPWGWNSEDSATLLLARLESVLWYPLLILAGVGIAFALRNLSIYLFPILLGGGILLMYALTEGNIGTAYRHRGELVWIVVLLAACGFHSLALWRSREMTH